MRTNIVLDDELIAEAKRYSHAKTKTALVDEALRLLIEVRGEAERRQTYAEKVAEIRRKMKKLPPLPSSLDIIRRDRERL